MKALLKRKRVIISLLVGLVLLIFVVSFADLHQLEKILTEANTVWLVLCVTASLSSYCCIAAVMYYILLVLREKLPFKDVFEIALLSCSVNYLVAFAGLSGLAAKIYMLAKENVMPSKTLSVSILHGFLTNTIAVVFVFLGFYYSFSYFQMSAYELQFGIIVLMIAFLLTWVTIKIMLDSKFRQGFYRLGTTLWNKLTNFRITKKWRINKEKADEFFASFDQGMQLLVENVRNLWKPCLYAALDWGLMILCLELAFVAVGHPLNFKILIIGFSVNIFTSLFSVVPASLGIMEGAMAGSFTLMGVSYESALAAVIVYRIAYYLIPMIISVFFYHRFFPRGKELESESIVS